MRRILFSVLLIITTCIILGSYIGSCDRDVIPWYTWVITSVAIVGNWLNTIGWKDDGSC